MLEGVEQAFGNLVGGPGPDIDHFIVSLAVRDEAAIVLVLYGVHVASRLSNDILLFLGDDHVADADRQTALGRVGEAQILQMIKKLRRPQVAAGAKCRLDDLRQPLLIEKLIDKSEPLRNNLVKDHPPRSRFDYLSVDANLDAGVQPHLVKVVGDDDFVG